MWLWPLRNLKSEFSRAVEKEKPRGRQFKTTENRTAVSALCDLVIRNSFHRRSTKGRRAEIVLDRPRHLVASPGINNNKFIKIYGSKHDLDSHLSLFYDFLFLVIPLVIN